MLTSASVAQDFSTCLRCQYRLAFRHRPRSRRRNRLLNTPAPRYMTADHRLLQKESQAEPFAHGEEDVFPLAQDFNDAKSRRTQWHHDDIYSIGTLEMDALGKPTEIIMLRQAQRKDAPIRTDKAEDAIENHHFSLSPTEILKKIQEEDALVNAGRVSKNIEMLRTSWLSQLQDRYVLPTGAEYLQMVKALQEGFTMTQLVDYYETETARLPENIFELSRPHTTDLYTRASWVPGCSPFTGKGADSLFLLRGRLLASIKKNEDGKKIISGGLETNRKVLGSKTTVAGKIIRVLWNVKVLDGIGELNVWIRPTHFALLLSDRKHMFNRVAETCGAKVDVSQSRHIIRITSDRDTCCDVFKFVARTLEKIHGVDVYLPPEPPKGGSRWLHERTFLKESLIQQIEQLSGTIIRKIPHPTPRRKGLPRQYRIFYLGPETEDLENAKRNLTQTLQTTASKLPLVTWHDQELVKGSPHPVEVGSALPLVARGIHWSRWASPIRRSSQALEVGEGPDLSKIWSRSLSNSVFDRLFPQTKPYPSNHPKKHAGLFWSRAPTRETFASFGQVIYLSKKLKELHKGVEGKRINVRSKTLRKTLASQRQLLGGFPGLRSVLQDANMDMRTGEDLRIRLRPSPEFLMKTEEGRIFPEMELRVNCDPTTRTCELSHARLIVQRREVDVLLPTEAVDLRFSSETHLPSGAKIDPQILKFLNSSNVNVYRREALKITTALCLSIPARSVRKPPSGAALAPSACKSESSEDSFLEESPDIAVNYVLSSVEHWSYMSGDHMGLNLEYAVIGAGKMGRKEEMRMVLHKADELRLNQGAFKTHFKAPPEMIQQLRSFNCTPF